MNTNEPTTPSAAPTPDEHKCGYLCNHCKQHFPGYAQYWGHKCKPTTSKADENERDLEVLSAMRERDEAGEGASGGDHRDEQLPWIVGQVPPSLATSEYKYLGNYSAVDPAYSRDMYCDACQVRWTGCWDNFMCPKCGRGEIPSCEPRTLEKIKVPAAQVAGGGDQQTDRKAKCPKCDLSYYVDENGKCHRCGTKGIQQTEQTKQTAREWLASWYDETRPAKHVYKFAIDLADRADRAEAEAKGLFAALQIANREIGDRTVKQKAAEGAGGGDQRIANLEAELLRVKDAARKEILGEQGKRLAALVERDDARAGWQEAEKALTAWMEKLNGQIGLRMAVEAELAQARQRIAELEKGIVEIKAGGSDQQTASEWVRQRYLDDLDLEHDEVQKLADMHDAQKARADRAEAELYAMRAQVEALMVEHVKAICFIKELNATKFEHGRQYRSRCGKFLAALKTTNTKNQ